MNCHVTSHVVTWLVTRHPEWTGAGHVQHVERVTWSRDSLDHLSNSHTVTLHSQHLSVAVVTILLVTRPVCVSLRVRLVLSWLVLPAYLGFLCILLSFQLVRQKLTWLFKQTFSFQSRSRKGKLVKGYYFCGKQGWVGGVQGKFRKVSWYFFVIQLAEGWGGWSISKFSKSQQAKFCW